MGLFQLNEIQLQINDLVRKCKCSKISIITIDGDSPDTTRTNTFQIVGEDTYFVACDGTTLALGGSSSVSENNLFGSDLIQSESHTHNSQGYSQTFNNVGAWVMNGKALGVGYFRFNAENGLFNSYIETNFSGSKIYRNDGSITTFVSVDSNGVTLSSDDGSYLLGFLPPLDDGSDYGLGITNSGAIKLTTRASLKETIGFTADGGGTTIATGKIKGFFTIPYAATITGWNIVVDAGTCTIKVWKIATGTAKPTSSNSINTSGVSISSGTAIHSSTVTDFTTTSVAANDIFAYNIEAISGVSELTFGLELDKV